MLKSKNADTFLDRLADKIAWFMGSWWGVVVHVIWWGLWLLLGFDFLMLTMWLSIEAIVIGIFILMVQNRSGEKGQKLLETYNRKELEDLERDLKLAEKGERKQMELMREYREIKKSIDRIEKMIKNK